MWRIKVAFRNLIRYRLNSGIIVVSLSLGFACMNLITLFVIKEYNVDTFHKYKDSIYALLADNPFLKGEKMYFIRNGAAEYMKHNFLEVKDFCRISSVNPIKVTVDRQDYFEKSRVIAASSNFFDFFSYRLLVNTPKSVLNSYEDIVISDVLAKKYFGASDPVGQRITLVTRGKQNEMIVSGVFKKPEETTQINFDMVQLIGETDSQCYLRVAKDIDIRQLEEKFDRNKAVIPIVNDGTPGTHYLKDLRSAYFDTSRRQATDNSRNKTDLIVAMIIAFMILAVALFNYFGLINNRLLEKSREHAIRRINGSLKRDLITDFMTEVAFLIAIAFCISIFLMSLMLPFFNQLTSSSISLTYIFSLHNYLLIGIPVLVYLASYLLVILKIEDSLQFKLLTSGKFSKNKKSHFRIFNIIQLAISITLLSASIVILKQINYITNKPIGLDKDVLEIKIANHYKNLSNVFKAELEKHPCIEMVSLAEASPVLEHWSVLLKYLDNGIEKEYTPSVFLGDQNYTKVLGIKFLEGSDFSQDGESNKNKCIINESLARLFPGQNLIGKELPGYKEIIVIGVAKDFHYGSLKELIAPAFIMYGNTGFNLLTKPVKGQVMQAREVISQTWNRLITDFPLNIEPIGDRYEWMHRENASYARLIGACCFISMFLSMIGLFAVSFHTTRQRIKEIGIRKVNGARTNEVMSMLNQDFIKWIAIAFVISCPVAWYAMHKWLENFAYKTELSWWIFAAAGAIAMIVALLTVSLQSWRAATRNPVESLRYE